MEIKATENQIKIKANAIFKCIGIGSLAMVCMTLFQFFPLDDFDFSFDTSFDMFGFLFLCFWFTIVLSMGGVAFFIGCKTVTIDETGVSCKSLCYKKTLTWEEIKDYGASYSGQTRGQGNTYTLYFAAKEQKIKSDCKKKLKGNMIKTYVIGDTYGDVIHKVFPFCRNFTEVRPFAAEDRFHWI